MLIIFTLLLITMVICLILAYRTYDGELLAIPAGLCFIGAVVVFIVAAKWQVSSQTLTGYIYQRSEAFGYVRYDLRYAQNAGQDNQPSFCVKNGSSVDDQLQELVGDEDTKVTVDIPSKSFFMANNPFQCASEAMLRDSEAQ